jgi:hypothetical protein
LADLSVTAARKLSGPHVFPGILAEVSLTLWLLVIGVNGQRWKEQARAASIGT